MGEFINPADVPKVKFYTGDEAPCIGMGTFGSDRFTADQIAEAVDGDILAIASTGAYNYSMSSNYNRIIKPAVVFVKDGKAQLVVKRETYDDLVRNDLELV